MNKVYRHRPMARDEFMGRVDLDGRVYESRLGPDRYIGRVELETGKIFENRIGPDQWIGRVEPESGKVYLNVPGPDEYLGRVAEDGSLYQHKPLAADEYMGKVIDMVSLIHGGAAFLLLVVPAHDTEAEAARQSEQRANEEPAEGDVQGGTAPAGS